MPDRFRKTTDEDLEVALEEAQRANSKPKHLIQQRDKVFLEDVLMERMYRNGIRGDEDEEEIYQALYENARRMIVAHLKPKEALSQLVEMGFHSGLSKQVMEELRRGFRNSALRRIVVHLVLIGAVGGWYYYCFGPSFPVETWDEPIVLAKLSPLLVAVFCFFGFLNALGVFLKMAKSFRFA